MKINVGQFDVGKADIKPEGKKEIAELTKQVAKHEPDIRIEGHTDSTGGDKRNYELSLERSHAVYSEFLHHGIPASKIKKIGHGKTKPIAENNTASKRAKNRRVEVFVDLKD